ncbi:MAG: FHA domain-containing protein [Usitatibacter sp.]
MGARIVLSLEGELVTEVELTKAVTVVGRHPACDIVIDHPAISGRHMLFRIVNRTVYAEDLASTNGMRVNGISASHQVVHHLDLIEAGKHKLHFFDDDLLAAGGVGNLESTVQTDYERTMMVEHVPDARPPAVLNRAEDDFARTMLIRGDTTVRTGPAQETVRTGTHAAYAGLALRVLSGGAPGEIVDLARANTMIGTAGADTALVIRRAGAFFIARLSGSRALRLNGSDLQPGTHPIAPQDRIDVGGWSFEVIYAHSRETR